MNTQSPAMAIISHDGDRDFATQVVDTGDGVPPHIAVGSPLEVVPEFSKRTYSPTYLLIDIGERGPDVLSEIDTIAEYCEPGTRVVVAGYINDVNFYRELKTRGVIEYFTKPAKVSDLRNALFSKSVASSNRGKGEVIAFMSAASGDGASTIALNTAYTLATAYNKSVVLVDMDYQFGMIAKNLDLASQFGIRELFEHPERGIDRMLIERMLLTYKNTNLKIIASPNQLQYIPEVPDDLLRNLVNTLSENYDFVVLDLPHIWTPLISSVLTRANYAVMVAQLWLRSITHSSRLLSTWRRVGIKDTQIRLVANRSGSKFKEAISAGDFERVCGLSFSAHFDNDTKSVIAAENNGRTILEGGNSDLSIQFKKFAASFSKTIADEEEDSGTKNKSRFSILVKK